MSFLLASCNQDDYRGEYPELYSVAVNSILGASGFVEGPPRRHASPSIVVLRVDDYGRVLFSYSERLLGVSPTNRVIMQKTEDGYAYFYPHYNFISRSHDDMRQIEGEMLEAFKETNSWNQELSDDSEFVRVPIVRRKEEGPVSREDLAEVYKSLFPYSNPDRAVFNMTFLRADEYGRAVYLGVGREGSEGLTYLAILFQPDHSFDFETGQLEIEEEYFNNYQTKLREFMEANGWDTPFEE